MLSPKSPQMRRTSVLRSKTLDAGGFTSPASSRKMGPPDRVSGMGNEGKDGVTVVELK